MYVGTSDVLLTSKGTILTAFLITSGRGKFVVLLNFTTKKLNISSKRMVTPTFYTCMLSKDKRSSPSCSIQLRHILFSHKFSNFIIQYVTNVIPIFLLELILLEEKDYNCNVFLFT